MVVVGVLLWCALPASVSAAVVAQSSPVAYIVEARVDADPILAYRGYGPSNADWHQVFNPTWVEPSVATGNRSGLLLSLIHI